MKAAPWFRFFPTRFQSDTSGLKAIEKGVYVSLLIAMHERGEPIVEEHKRLAKRSGTTPKAFGSALQTLIDDGMVTRTPTGLWAPSAQEEADYRASKSKSAQENASKRWKKDQQNQQPENATAGKSQSKSQISDSERDALNERHASDKSEPSGRRAAAKVVGDDAPRLGAASSLFNKDEDFTIPGVGTGWVVNTVSFQPLTIIVEVRDDDGSATRYRVENPSTSKMKVAGTHFNDGSVDYEGKTDAA